MRLALFSDIHGNLPALEAIIEDIKNEDIDYTIFLGDAIGFGPKPYECLKLLLDSNIYFNYGNHELYALNHVSEKDFLPSEQMIVKHHKWVQEQVDSIINRIEDDPKVDEDMLIKKNNKKLYLCHYASKNGKFLSAELKPDKDYLDSIFNDKYNVIFYGHNHDRSIIKSTKTTYVCLGSSGCVYNDNTFYTIVDIGDEIIIDMKKIKYDRNKFLEDFNTTNYPLKEHLGTMFFGIKE